MLTEEPDLQQNVHTTQIGQNDGQLDCLTNQLGTCPIQFN
jgi:hypothetical protein